MKTALIPEENVKDLAEMPDNIKNKIEIVPVKWIDQVLERALEHKPEALPAATDASAGVQPAADVTAASTVVTH